MQQREKLLALVLILAVVVADIEAIVIAIEPKFLLLQIDDSTYRLPLGKNLRPMVPLSTPEKADANSAREDVDQRAD